MPTIAVTRIAARPEPDVEVNSQFQPWLETGVGRDEGDDESNTAAAEPDLTSFSRIWRVFMTARIAIASVLVSLQLVVYMMGGGSSHFAVIVCGVYLLATVAVRIAGKARPPRSRFDTQWLLTIGVDVMAFSLLEYLQAGGINYAPLFALPVLLASVLGPILLAFGTAATVTVLLLANAWWSSLQGSELNTRLLQAALSGSGFFLVALLANQLAIRLAQQELRTRVSQSATRMQALVSDLVVASLAEGVLVVDAEGVVRSSNPACRSFLGVEDTRHHTTFMLAREAAWTPLLALVDRTFSAGASQKADVTLHVLGMLTTRLRVRTRLAQSSDSARDHLCVMFLEDLREMEARVRTEKMAAMGRMSAAVAHEIRNPLAAITQANALLEEDLVEPAHRQLTTMVRQNALRLAKIVDEILNVSRVQEQHLPQAGASLPLDITVRRITVEWAMQNATTQRFQATYGAPEAAVWFDEDHLRRVMINLLDNAMRYAGESPASIQVSTSAAGGNLRLSVWSDGAPLETSVRAHLFEPFFSSESRSSGLGLYICRELCARYGAQIHHQRASRVNSGKSFSGNEFFVVLQPAASEVAPVATLFETVSASE